jgi:hypothetical protein
MSKLHDIELMEHADGERDHAARLREPDARGTDEAKIKAIGELGELVRGHLELSADAVPAARFEQLWDAVDKSMSAVPEKRGVWSHIGGWFERHRGHVITGVVSAGAVAALALVLRGSAGEGTIATTHSSTSGNVTPVAYRPTEIESLDTPDGDSTVFNLNDEDGPATVIWVTPEDTVEGI